MSMAVCTSLGIAVGNDSIAATCQSALLRGQAVIDAALWVESTGGNGSYYAAVQGVPGSLMADCLYGQVLAYTAGLGSVVNVTKAAEHLRTERERNDTPFGLRVVTGPQIGGTNTDVWQGRFKGGVLCFGRKAQGASLAKAGHLELGDKERVVSNSSLRFHVLVPSAGASPNWATLNLHLGSLGVPVQDALSQAEKALNNWRESVRDQWTVAGITTSDTGEADVETETRGSLSVLPIITGPC